MYIIQLTDGSKMELRETPAKGKRWHRTESVPEGQGTRYESYDEAYWCGRAWQEQIGLSPNIWEVVRLPNDKDLLMSHLGLPGVGFTFCGLDYSNPKVKSYDLVSLDTGPGWCPMCMDELEKDDLACAYVYSNGDCQGE